MTDAEVGNIYGTPDGEVVRVRRVGRNGWFTAVVVGGPKDGEERRRNGVPADWKRYPS